MKAPHPIVSVIVPAFNRAKYLPDALESVCAQRVSGVEIVVVDDGSTDDTEAVVAAYGAAVRYLRQEHSGAAAARNTGVALSTGPYVAFLDSDDVWLKGKLERELSVLESDPDVDAVISDSERWRESKLICSSWLAERGVTVSGDAPIRFRPAPHLRAGKVFATCSLTIRRTALARIGHPPFDTSFETHEDVDFALRIYHGCSIVVLPKTLAQVRRFEDGSRPGRQVPGTEYSPSLKRSMARRKYRAYEKALALRGWPADALPGLHAARRDAARDFADNLIGWGRGHFIPMAFAELRHAALASAASVVLRGLMPEQARVALRYLVAKPGSQGATVEARALKDRAS